MSSEVLIYAVEVGSEAAGDKDNGEPSFCSYGDVAATRARGRLADKLVLYLMAAGALGWLGRHRHGQGLHAAVS